MRKVIFSVLIIILVIISCEDNSLKNSKLTSGLVFAIKDTTPGIIRKRDTEYIIGLNGDKFFGSGYIYTMNSTDDILNDRFYRFAKTSDVTLINKKELELKNIYLLAYIYHLHTCHNHDKVDSAFLKQYCEEHYYNKYFKK